MSLLGHTQKKGGALGMGQRKEEGLSKEEA